MDVGSRRYETFEDLYGSCIRVASAVGIICLHIFGCRDRSARQYATELGVALQLTNILRDVPGDLARGRVYLPQADLRRHGVTEDDLKRESESSGGGVRSPAVKALLAQQAARARDYYRRAAAALPSAGAGRLTAAEIMGAIYRAILDRIERSDYDIFSRVVRIPRPRRAMIAAVTWLRMLVHLLTSRRRRHRRRLRGPGAAARNWPAPAPAFSCSTRGRSLAGVRPLSSIA